MRTHFGGALVALLVTFPTMSAFADPGRPFLSHMYRTQEQLARAFEESQLHGNLTPEVALRAMQEAGAPIDLWSKVPDYIRELQPVACTSELFQNGIYWASDDGKSFGRFDRDPVTGEMCYVDPFTGFAISGFCGNPVVLQTDLIFGQPKSFHCTTRWGSEPCGNTGESR